MTGGRRRMRALSAWGAGAFWALLASALIAASESHMALRGGWTRPAAAGMNAAGYLAIVNRGGAERLVSAASPASAGVTIHGSRTVGSVSTMRALGDLAVGPGASVTLRPGGYHLMLEGLKAPLKPGEQVPIALTFSPAGLVRGVLTVGAGPPWPGPQGR